MSRPKKKYQKPITSQQMANIMTELQRRFPGSSYADLAERTGLTMTAVESVGNQKAGRPTVEKLEAWLACN